MMNRIMVVTFLLLGLSHANAAQTKQLTFGIVPQQSAKRLATLWTPVLQHLSQKSDLNIVFSTAKDIPTFEKRLATGEYDIAYMNPYHYVVFSKQAGYVALAKQKDKKIRGVIVAKLGSNIHNIEDLQGLHLAFPAPAAFAATILPRAELNQHGIQFTSQYVSSHDSVYLNVSKGFFPAGGGIKRTLNNMQEKVRSQLQIIWKTAEYTPHAIATQPNVDITTRHKILSALLNMHHSEQGKVLLKSINFKGFEEAMHNDWDDVRALNIDTLMTQKIGKVMNISLRNKTILGIAVIEASLLIILVVTAVDFMRSTLNDDLVKRASTVATLFATTTKDAVLSYDLASLEAFCVELMKNPDIAYVRVLNHQAQVLAQAGDKKWLATPFLHDTQVSAVTDGIFDSFAAINESEHNFGRVELGIDISNIEKSITKIQNWTSSIALIEMLLVALFSFVLGTYLTGQLKGLRKAARGISKNVSSGQFSHRKVKVKGKDELAEVAEAFNTLTTTLEVEHQRREAYQQDLQELNRTLEQKVTKRTSLLNQRNEQLEHSHRELHEAQQQLVQAEKMASVGQLAAGVAHEINNPLGFVASNLSALKQYIHTYRQLSEQVTTMLSTEDSEQTRLQAEKLSTLMQTQNIKFINQDTEDLFNESIQGLERVKEIVKGLQLFSRADSDEKQWSDINDCVNTTLNMVSNELKYHCDIKKSLAPLPDILINVGKISQVLTNLLINAGQAIDRSGHILIITKLQKNNIIITIEDDGCGIGTENMSKLFDPFFTTKAAGIGTGLGLSISYGIIQDHGGDIAVQSVLGQGSCFTIKLPIENDSKIVKEITNE